ncbi:9067_t:CDS:2, partial [Dentiscutata erythropus]
IDIWWQSIFGNHLGWWFGCGTVALHYLLSRRYSKCGLLQYSSGSLSTFLKRHVGPSECCRKECPVDIFVELLSSLEKEHRTGLTLNGRARLLSNWIC